MSDFVIIPDASSDLTKELRERFNIPDYIRGTLYHPDGRAVVADLDWEQIDPVTYYTSMSGRKMLYKTASAQRGDIVATYEKQLKEGKDILSITLSSGLSGTYQICKGVAEELMEQYPERKILVIDSLRYSTALSLLVIKASLKQQEGATLEELEYLTLGSLRKAVMEGDVVNGTVMAGQIAGMVKKQQSCKEIVEEIMNEASTLLEGSKWMR